MSCSLAFPLFKPIRQAAGVLFALLLMLQASRAACVTEPMMQGQDPEVEFKDGIFNLVQSDGTRGPVFDVSLVFNTEIGTRNI